VALLGAVLFALFGHSRSGFVLTLHRVLELGAVGLAFYVCKAWRDAMLHRLDKSATGAPGTPSS
jgi:hypothetical protein